MVLIDMEMPKRCANCRLIGGELCLAAAAMGRHLDKDYRYGIKDRPMWCPVKPFTPQDPQITTSIYDQEEIHHNCTVQILTNSVTGEVSVGWWKENNDEI